MKKILFLLLLLSFCALAVDKDILYRQTSRYHHNIGYSAAKKYLFGQIFLENINEQYFVTDLYCEKKYGEDFGVGPMLNASGVFFNCEHSWPKKRFNPKHSYKMQESDLHHLFPVDAKMNSYRGNMPFAEVEDGVIDSDCSESRIGRPADYPAGPTSFEPPDEYKGNIARALFYFSIRYQMGIDSIEEFYLRRWNELDPVDSLEREQNEQIELIQGNRNPFVDDPSLISLIQDF